MTLVIIGLAVWMFMNKKKGSIEPSEPSIHKVTLTTGKVKTAVIIKGGVKVGEQTFLTRPEKCPVGYKQSIFTGKCIPESVIQK